MANNDENRESNDSCTTGIKTRTITLELIRKRAEHNEGLVSTLEEIALEGRESFLEAGGTNYSVVPCLNDSPGALDVIEDVVWREIAGWATP